jgi:gamma-glutamyltranspeptidase/glutathione hydrolase
MSSGLPNRLPAQAGLEMLAEGGSAVVWDGGRTAITRVECLRPITRGIDARRAPADRGALKLAFADALAHVADIDHIQARPGQLLDKGYLRQRSTLIDRTHAKGVTAGTSPKGSTGYLTAADASGLMVPMIQSNYMGFGSGVVVHGTGVSLQNRGTGLVTTPGHPKPCRSNQTSVPRHHSGLHGQGRNQATAWASASRRAHRRLRPKPAGSMQRPALQLAAGHASERRGGFPPATLEELRRRGHEIITVDDYHQFGSCLAIWRLDDGYLAASDPRGDDQAAGPLMKAADRCPINRVPGRGTRPVRRLRAGMLRRRRDRS